MREAAGEIVDKLSRIVCAPSSNQEGRNEFRIGINGRPGPDIAKTRLTFQLFRQILFLRVAKAPDLIALNSLAGQVTESFVLIPLTGLTKIDKQLENRTFYYVILFRTRNGINNPVPAGDAFDAIR